MQRAGVGRIPGLAGKLIKNNPGEMSHNKISLLENVTKSLSVFMRVLLRTVRCILENLLDFAA